MAYKSKRSKATDITVQTKHEVLIRDNGCCILCGRQGSPNAHVVPRSNRGLGIKENIVTLCHECHYSMDFTSNRKAMLKQCEEYLENEYPSFHKNGFDKDKVQFKKWGGRFD